jgi:glycerol-3-phosphate dehydrogenase (NAD(P)+)
MRESDAMLRIGVIGAGAFGTALAATQAAAGRDVVLWGRDRQVMAEIAARGENRLRLPGRPLPAGLVATSDLGRLADRDVLLLALPAQATAGFLATEAAALPDVPLVLCAKGLERGSFRRQSEIAAALADGRPVAVLTGPGFADDLARGLPTALTLAAATPALGPRLQSGLATPRLRLYLTDDVIGAELGGALKNVVALACGMAEGRGLGQSARAALMTRGFAEMVRLATALGARPATLAGLSGLGDLSLTCNSRQSRNFAAGCALGAGEAVPAGTVEGLATARAACELGRLNRVEMPIAEAVAGVVEGHNTLAEAIEGLLARPLREE